MSGPSPYIPRMQYLSSIHHTYFFAFLYNRSPVQNACWFHIGHTCPGSRVICPTDSREELDVPAAFLTSHLRRPHHGESLVKAGGRGSSSRSYIPELEPFFFLMGAARVESCVHTRSFQILRSSKFFFRTGVPFLGTIH